MAEPLKVLILGQDPDLFERPGGAPNDTRERHLAYVRELQRRRPGSEVRIAVHTRGPGGTEFDSPFEGLEIYGTNSRSRLTAPLGLLRLVRRFKRDGWVPDIVSCQTGYEEGLIAFLARLPGSRVQIQVHNDFYGEAFGGRNVVHRIQRWGIRLSIRWCEHARVVSAGIMKSLIETGDMPAERISIAPVPVVFKALPPTPDKKNPVVLFVGRLVPQKNLPLWCSVARLINKQMPQVRFWIVGSGSEHDKVKKELVDLGDSVKLFGSVPYKNLDRIYAESSVFLLTSHYEGLGRVVVEAMYAEVPVVSTDIVGPQDLIDDGVTGRLVQPEPQALAEACLDLLSSPAKARAIADAAKAWSEENYSFSAVTRKLVSSWEAAALQPRRRG